MRPAGAARGKPVALVLALTLIALLCCALAVWQVQRLQWKEALIARVAAGMAAPPVQLSALPQHDAPKAWEYRRVALAGRYDPRGTVLVSGASTMGSGYWVLTPLRAVNGTLYVNRGFVPLGTRAADLRPATPTGDVSVVGLVRMTEPGGGFLRANRPAEGRWYSRDIRAIAQAGRITADTRIFIDASAETPRTHGSPVPGLTVVNFPNNHLVYALTWIVLAALSAGAAIVLWQKAK